MSHLTLILLSAGNSSRFLSGVKKQWLRIEHDPLWLHVTNRLNRDGLFTKIIITAHKDEISFMQSYCDYTIVEGGATRQESLNNALAEVDSAYVLVNDIARACISTQSIKEMLIHVDRADCIVPTLKLSDTIVFQDETINRDEVKRIQTPQLSKTAILRKALDTSVEYTDESSAIVAHGGTRLFIDGSEDANKITFLEDLKQLKCLSAPSSATLIGNGFDVHAFEREDTQRAMMLCGIEIDVPYSFKAHSDGDVAIHSLIDALLGAAGLGDIGMLFPDTDQTYKNIDSCILLERANNYLTRFGYIINNVDITIAAQAPKINPYKNQMRKRIATLLGIQSSRVNVKATTTEKLGFIGREEGVGVFTSVSLNYYNWKI